MEKPDKKARVFQEGVLFPIGHTIISSEAREVISWNDVMEALRRHSSGDWGEAWEERRRENDDALHEGGRVFSVYRSSRSVRFCVISDPGRRITRVVLAGEDDEEG